MINKGEPHVEMQLAQHLMPGYGGYINDDLAEHDEMLCIAVMSKRHTIDLDELLSTAEEHEHTERPQGEPEPGSQEWYQDWIDSMPEDPADFPVPDSADAYSAGEVSHAA